METHISQHQKRAKAEVVEEEGTPGVWAEEDLQEVGFTLSGLLFEFFLEEICTTVLSFKLVKKINFLTVD